MGSHSGINKDVCDKLESAGYLKRVKERHGFFQGDFLMPNDEKSPFMREDNVLKVKICEKVFDHITGIAQEGKTTAIVEFTWKYDNFQPAYEIVKPAAELKQPSPIKYVMTKYDDGWRLGR